MQIGALRVVASQQLTLVNPKVSVMVGVQAGVTRLTAKKFVVNVHAGKGKMKKAKELRKLMRQLRVEHPKTDLQIALYAYRQMDAALDTLRRTVENDLGSREKE